MPSRPRQNLERMRLKIRSKDRSHQEDRENIEDQPPNCRPRALTPPLQNTKESPQTCSTRSWRLSLSKRREQQTLNQGQSLLFSHLPTEIRLLIWEHYLCSQKLHIILSNQHTWKQSDSKIVGLACSESDDYCPCSHHCWGSRARRPAGGCLETIQHVGSRWHEEREWGFDTGRVDFVSLLQTCRLIYSEAIDMIYQNNTFLFNNTATIVDLSNTLLPQRLNLIRTVQLSFSDPGGPTWDSCCEVLATKMPNLRKLTIHLYPHVTKSLDSWLMPLHRITQTSTFEVLLIKPWYLDPQWERSLGLIDSPFQFVLADTKLRRLTYPQERAHAE
ncbi:hypothetical protein N7541_002971 [Penicillium brevicompactum]|uniref:DUF7730 domain-containing protein n=1 Tax=Penicillium brevicompactum TaxID=5074 RepID=A0A9W9UYH6_PENBR|nr:hypothetical protein N7541_002971 [Penicillium brevicompactum]